MLSLLVEHSHKIGQLYVSFVLVNLIASLIFVNYCLIVPMCFLALSSGNFVRWLLHRFHCCTTQVDILDKLWSFCFTSFTFYVHSYLFVMFCIILCGINLDVVNSFLTCTYLAVQAYSSHILNDKSILFFSYMSMHLFNYLQWFLKHIE